MAIPVVTEKKITTYVRSNLEKALATLPQQGTDVSFDPVKVEKALAPTPKQTISDTQPMIVKDDILLTPPITDEVIIAPPMAAETGSVLPLLVAGAILLMQ